jgi:acyl dehydratase
MKISSEFVGGRPAPIEALLTPRAAMLFAAGVGDANPLYFDDLPEEGALAPPLAAMMLTWPFSADFERTWSDAEGLGQFPFEVLTRRVHYTETLVWHGPLRPGVSLRVEGMMETIVPRRGGTLMMVRYDAFEADTNQPVFTEHVGAFLRGVSCPDKGRGEEDIPKPPECPAGSSPLWEHPLEMNLLTPYLFDGCTNMHFPIHTSPTFAKRMRLEGILVQGAATLSMAVREVVNRELGGNPALLRTVHGRFTGMVRPGDVASVRLLHAGKITNGLECFFEVLNENGKQVVSEGYVQADTGSLNEGTGRVSGT